MTLTVPLLMQKKTYSAFDVRQIFSGFVARPGVQSHQDFRPLPGASVRSVDVQAGSAYVQVTSLGQSSYYQVVNDAVVSLTCDVASSNTRIDQVVLRVKDSTVTTGDPDEAELFILKGTETAGATLGNRLGVAALPANSILLADLRVTPSMGTFDISYSDGGMFLDDVSINDRRAPALRDHRVSGILTGNPATVYAGSGFTLIHAGSTGELIVFDLTFPNDKYMIHVQVINLGVHNFGQATNGVGSLGGVGEPSPNGRGMYVGVRDASAYGTSVPIGSGSYLHFEAKMTS